MRRTLTRAVALVLAAAALGGMTVARAHAKTARTWYDDERLAVMRENLETYEWARDYVTGLLEGVGEEQPWKWGGHRFSVRRWAERDDEFFWQLMPTTRVTMVYDLDKYGISPRHGTAVREGRAFYHPWNYDPWGHPYQIQDPIDGTWYPSNDFGAGDLTSGPYPDDGTGMVIDGERYFPVREYAIATYLYCVVPLLDRMSQAWLLTGDETYAHKAAVLLAKVASEYPNPTDRADRCQKGPWGTRSGLVTDYIWETFKLTSMALTYDAIYDAIGEDEALVSFLQDKGVAVETPQDVREFIEESIFRIGMLALEQGVIRGNQGHHQETAMALALIMDDHDLDRRPNSRDIVEWCMYGDGQMAYIMSNGLFRDGGGFESPGYNTIKFDFISAATYFEQLRRLRPEVYPEDAYPDIFAHPKARAMFDWFIDLTVQDRFGPSIGDHGGSLLTPRKVSDFWGYALEPGRYRFGYRRYGDPRYARVFMGASDELPRGDPFERYDGEELLAAARRPEAAIEERTRLLDGYGVALLSSGEDAAPGYEQGTVIAWDYEANAVTVEGIAAEGLPGRFVRLFTDARSSAYRILAAEATDESVRLQLDQTNLLFEALIDVREDGRLSNAAAVLHWTAREDDAGALIPWRIWNRDAALVSEDGGAVRRIDAVPSGRTIYLQDAPPAAELAAEFTDANDDGRIIARAYDYAVGSRVEIARTADGHN